MRSTGIKWKRNGPTGSYHSNDLRFFICKMSRRAWVLVDFQGGVQHGYRCDLLRTAKWVARSIYLGQDYRRPFRPLPAVPSKPAVDWLKEGF